MSIEGIPRIGPVAGLGEIEAGRKSAGTEQAGAFTDTLKEALRAVDELQHESEAAQAVYAEGGEIDLHDVLIKLEEAELAFKTMMEVRNKLVEAYHEVMRIGG